MAAPLQIAQCTADAHPLHLLPQMANRHGLIAGATGTGKTVTLQVMAERFSSIGVPVFMADVKGDLAGLSQPGASSPKMEARIEMLGLEGFNFSSSPVVFWDVFGQLGHPVRTTISEMGPLLLARLLGLNDTQAGVLHIVFRIADESGMLLLDLKDLRALLRHAGENAREFTTAYGNISAASIGAIQRSLLELEAQGGDQLFGEPALDLHDFLQTDSRGRGCINILAAERLMSSPKTYATFLLWLLSDLFERLPEAGDLEKPKLVFFFDEAHLLFSDLPSSLREKIEQMVRLIRSKAVGVYFVSQNPLDIPDTVLGQLGNRVQHALRAFTPRDEKAVRSAAQTFRQNPELNTQQVLTELQVGEALVSLLDEKGAPTIVRRAWVLPPTSRLGVVTPEEREQVIRGSTIYGHYEQVVDRDSAHEMLERAAQERLAEAAREQQQKPAPAARRTPAPKGAPGSSGGGFKLPQPPRPRKAPAAPRSTGRKSDSVLEAAAKSAARSIGSQVGRQIVRGLMGSLFGKR